MSPELPEMTVRIDSETFTAKLRSDLAPESCRCLLKMLPYHGKVIHARWSGEAMWSPLAGLVPDHLALPEENAKGYPRPGDILLFAGEKSEPELLVVYGTSRFASVAGPLEGNPVISIADGSGRLAELGHRVLWGGALELRIEVSP